MSFSLKRCKCKRVSMVRYLRCKTLTFADGQEKQEHHKRAEEDSAAHVWWVCSLKRGKKWMKVVFWKLSGEAGSTAEVSLCFLRLLLFLSWLSQLLLFGCGPEELSFYSCCGNESFPRLWKVAQDGIVKSQEGIYRQVVVWMRACRGQTQLAFGEKNCD